MIVPARNGQAQLPRLLSALREQTLAPREYEVIVVDDGSRDGTAEVVHACGFARWSWRHRPGGSYAARNDGVGAARGTVLAFTDADCRPDPDWLAGALRELTTTGADLLAGRIEMVLRPRPSLAELVDAAHYLDQRSYAARGFGATANLVVRRAVIDRVGAFNANLVSNGDREFCLRATAAGFTLAYAHQAAINHDARRSMRSVARRAFRMGYGRGQTMALGTSDAASRSDNWLPARAYLPTWLGGDSAAAADRVRRVAAGTRGRLVEPVGYVLIGMPLLVGYGAGASAVWLSGAAGR